jgi:hypothetical protein
MDVLSGIDSVSVETSMVSCCVSGAEKWNVACSGLSGRRISVPPRPLSCSGIAAVWLGGPDSLISGVSLSEQVTPSCASSVRSKLRCERPSVSPPK